MFTPKPLVLVILDGWGYSENPKYNAIATANTPQWNQWWQTCPHMLLDASGSSVGLPDRQMGNSEVGHMHIGSGRVIKQDFTRINDAIADGSFSANPVINRMLDDLHKSHGALHIMGLFSPGGVHSHEEHLFALLERCAAQGLKSVYLHLFLDGRDTPPQSAMASFSRLQLKLCKQPFIQIASITGRYYAMDRDSRWERIAPVYQLLTQAQSEQHFDDVETAITSFYQQGIFDEFIPPTSIGENQPINDGDALFFFNFRADRARQLTEAFIKPDFKAFNRMSSPKLAHFVSMTQYDAGLPTEIAFPPIPMNNTLGEVIAAHGLKQLRIAETEKYAHVTFFFNGGIETPFSNESRCMVPSPKVATYDLQPEMSAPELTDKLIAAIQNQSYDVIICNYANADMVGHTGNMTATVQAIECLDQQLARLYKVIEAHGGGLLITADHGNAESMFDDATSQAHTAHTSLPVPLLFAGKGWKFTKTTGSLVDVAPTMLHLLGIAPPNEMSGSIIMERDSMHV